MAVKLTGIQQMTVTEDEKQDISGDDDVLIRLKSIGVCGSDVHYYLDGRIGSQVVHYPFVVGH